MMFPVGNLDGDWLRGNIDEIFYAWLWSAKSTADYKPFYTHSVSGVSETSKWLSQSIQQNIFTNASRSPAIPPSLIFSIDWRMPSAARPVRLVGIPRNPWKVTALLLTNPRGVNIRKWVYWHVITFSSKAVFSHNEVQFGFFFNVPLCTYLVKHRTFQ